MVGAEIQGDEGDIAVDPNRFEDGISNGSVAHLPTPIEAPAPSVAFGVEGAGVVPTETQLCYGNTGWHIDLDRSGARLIDHPATELSTVIAAPAPNVAFGVEGAVVEITGFEGGEGDTSGGVDCEGGAAVFLGFIPELLLVVVPPAPHATFSIASTGMDFAGGHLCESDGFGRLHPDRVGVVTAGVPIAVLAVVV